MQGGNLFGAVGGEAETDVRSFFFGTEPFVSVFFINDDFFVVVTGRQMIDFGFKSAPDVAFDPAV